MPDILPEGWASAPLTDLFDFRYGKALIDENRNAKGPFSVYGSNGIVGRHDQPVTKGPTIIIGRKGSVGEIHFSEDACWPIDTTYFVDEFPPGFTPKYWAYYFDSLHLGQQEKSSAIPGISRSDIYQLELPVPPLHEQRRVVAKVDALVARVEASQKRLAKIPTILKRFRRAILAAACSGRLTADWREGGTRSVEGEDGMPPVPETWRWDSVDSICDEIVDCPHSTPKWTASGRLCIRTNNLKPGFLDLSEVRYVSEAIFKSRRERLDPQPGDVVYSREGGILGIACIIPSGVELCLGQRMMLFRTRTGFVSLLLMHWLNSPFILSRVQELTGGSASPHLNVKDIKSFPVPIPPAPEQNEIVRRVRELFDFADHIEKRHAKAMAAVESLTQSILAKAFRGELVPTEAELAAAEGRDYESAEQLLERIAANRPNENSSQSGNARNYSAHAKRLAARR